MTIECRTDDGPDLGDLVIVLLASTLSGLRDRLDSDGFPKAAQCVAETVAIADHYLERLSSHA
ncbi:MAG: hypothetical protein LC808_01825 [Actinobacteria bacterium]|nr:hypothetical protein [Actinomycetota bacterium]